MSPEVIAGLVGAGIGALATLLVGFIARLWSAQDARARSRQEYVRLYSERLQRIISEPSLDELRALRHEMFQLAVIAVYVPRWENAVHLWCVIQDVRILGMAIDSSKNGHAQQGAVFNEGVDTLDALRGWARIEWNRRPIWFWYQLRTTRRDEWRESMAASRREAGIKRG